MRQRVHIAIRGAVQGVGFRPFVFRLASTLGLPGWVANTSQGVFVEADGEKGVLDTFVLRLQNEAPPLARIQSLEFSYLDPSGFTSFEIRESSSGGETTALVLPDIAPCPDCRAEILDPSNRRYRYPFTNCTHCGPRFTIIESLPYDRANTSMKRFGMCEACRREYEDPADRRFHAQPIACPECGPSLALLDGRGKLTAERDDALSAACGLIRKGQIVALKGLGGFQLIVDARNDGAVRLLRQRKHREEKPFAVMVADEASAREICDVSPMEERLLRSPEAPIVLLRKRPPSALGGTSALLAPSSPVAPRNPSLGLMLPSTPLHILLMRELGFPVVATSGNIADEPICIDEAEAVMRLAGIADVFLIHNRPIVRHADDSVARVVLGRELLLRRARGYSPLPVGLVADAPPLLAVGAHLKNTVAVAKGANVFLSQHIGDLESKPSRDAFERAIADMEQMFDVEPAAVVSDLHPEYSSTQFALGLSLPRIAVQHHFAHVASCMADNQLTGRVLGVSWDGTGYGPDGNIWGGEFLSTDGGAFRRLASFRPFRLPGGEQAIKEPRRSALALLYELLGPGVFTRTDLAPLHAFNRSELGPLRTMLEGGFRAPWTTSAGRLFDAVGSLLGLAQVNSFEGQAAMALEFSLSDVPGATSYRIPVLPHSGTPALLLDWGDMIYEILNDLDEGIPTGWIAARFHNALARAIVDVAELAGEPRVVLTGGCFQNMVLLQMSVAALRNAGFQPYWHQRVPPNDGGIALGQIAAAAMQQTDEAQANGGATIVSQVTEEG
jgi:hydrogenase maturation protein HypF